MVKTNGSADRKGKNPQRYPSRQETDSQFGETAGDQDYEPEVIPVAVKREHDRQPAVVAWGDPLDQPENHPRKGKKYRSLELDDNQEADLAHWIQSHPEFYDRSSRGFKNSEMKTQLWNNKGKELGVDPELVKVWYTSMRTRYGKLSEEGSKSFSKGRKEYQTFRDKWILQTFAFLDGHIIRHRANRCDVQVKEKVARPHQRPKSSSEATDEEAEEEDEDRTGTPVSLQSTPGEPGTSTSGYPIHPVGKRRRKTGGKHMKEGPVSWQNLRERVVEPIKPKLEVMQHPPTPVPVVPSASRAQWGAWITSCLPEIHDSLWDDFQAQSFKLVTKYTRQSRLFREQERQQPFAQQLDVHQHQASAYQHLQPLMSASNTQVTFPSMVPAFGSSQAVPVSVFPAGSNPHHGAGNFSDSDCGENMPGGSASESESDVGV